MNNIIKVAVSPETAPETMREKRRIMEKLGVLTGHMGLNEALETLCSIDSSKYISVFLEHEDVGGFYNEDSHVFNVIGIREKTPEDEMKEERETLERLRMHRDLLEKQLAAAVDELSRRDVL